MSKKERKILKRPDRVKTNVRSGGSRTVEPSNSKSQKGKKEGGKK